MDNSNLYLKMCLVAPKEITKPFTINDNVFMYSKQILYCTYHKCFVGKDYDSCFECEKEHKKEIDLWIRTKNSLEDEDKEYEKFMCSDDYCINSWIRLPQQDEIQKTLANYYAEQGLQIRKNNLNERIFSLHYIKVAFLDFAHWLGEQYYDKSYVCVPTNVFISGEQLWFAYAMWEIFSKKWNDFEWGLIKGNNV